jgi:phospholipase/carboxylesterase
MKRQRWGGLDVVVTGEGDGPVVVLMHGFGAPAEDLVPLARYVDAPPGTRWVFPAAPMELGSPFGEARAWWMIDTARFVRDLESGRGATWTTEVPAGLAEARERVIALCAEVRARLGERLVLGGFSQGAMLACDVALRTPEPLAGLALLSATIVAEDEWRPRFRARRGLRVFQSHGRADPLLPYAVAERLRMLWEDGGADVEFVGFGGGHELPPEVLDALGGWL